MEPRKTYEIVCETFICEEEPCVCYSMHSGEDAIRHISTDRIFVEAVTNLVNRIGLSPKQTRDLLEVLLS